MKPKLYNAKSPGVWSFKILLIQEEEIVPSYIFITLLLRIDGVGPDEQRLSTNKLQHFVHIFV